MGDRVCDKICKNILEAMGNTPLIQLNRLVSPNDARVLVKYEGLNVGGSIKTRTAYAMIQAAEDAGLLHPGSIIVEPSSGNQGIGLALVGIIKNYPVTVIMPDSVSTERRLLMQQYGARVVLVRDEGDIGACIGKCLQTALDMARKDPNVFIPQQFENPNNVRIQRETTAQEILRQVDGKIDAFCSGIGTGGTLTGVGEALRQANRDILIAAVEPENAAILSGSQQIGTHQQMGIGDGIMPGILNQEIYDEIFLVSDREAIQTARDLASKEGMLVGISSGSNVSVALKLAKRLGAGKTVVTILPDTGERYFSTDLFLKD